MAFKRFPGYSWLILAVRGRMSRRDKLEQDAGRMGYDDGMIGRDARLG